MTSTIEYYGISKLDLKRLLPYVLKIANTGTNVTKKEALDIILCIADHIPNNVMNSLIGKDGLTKGPNEQLEKH